MAEPRASRPIKIGRRSLDRLRTADFISEMDLLTIIIVILTAYINTGRFTGFVHPPWSIVMAGTAILLLRMIVLTSMSGSMRKLLAGSLQIVNSFYGTFTSSITDAEGPQWPIVRAMKEKSGGPLRTANVAWYSLLVLGVLGLVLIVGGSGGAANSPFRQILVATFILGQFRAPTSRGIWALFAFGLVGVTSSQLLAIILRHIDPTVFDFVHFSGTYNIAPDLMVGFITTMVYWLTFLNEAKRDANQPDTRSGA